MDIQHDDTGTPPAPDVLLQNHRRFLSFLRARVRDAAAAEDILQTAYAKGLRAAPAVKDTRKLIPWFYRLLRNAVIDHYRTTAAEKRAQEVVAREWDRSADAPALERTICRCVTALLPDLPPKDAALLRRAEIDDEKVKDIAADLGLSPSAASVRLHRARKALRGKLLKTCGSCADRGCADCSCRM